MFVLGALKEFHAPVLTPFFQILTAFWNPFLFFQDLLYAQIKKKTFFLEAKLAGEEVTEIVLKLVGRVARYLLPATRSTVRYYRYRA